jgi:hypothetical protein
LDAREVSYYYEKAVEEVTMFSVLVIPWFIGCKWLICFSLQFSGSKSSPRYYEEYSSNL